MKMVGLHVLSHTDDKDHAVHCVICDHSLSNNITPALSPEIQVIDITDLLSYPENKKHNDYHFVLIASLEVEHLFSRPPPYLI